MVYFILLTLLSVSIDSFICGLYLGECKHNKFLVVAIESCVIFLMCLFTGAFGRILSDSMHLYANVACGAILISVGLFNLIKKDDNDKNGESNKNARGVFKYSVCLGFVVGIDCAFANLSLALINQSSIFICLCFCLSHCFFTFIANLIAKFIKKINLKKAYLFSPIVLIILGAFKLVEFFI